MLRHRRLGHLNRQGLGLLKNSIATGINYTVRNERPCEACVMGKQAREPLRRSGKRAKDLLELIHSDICGPMEMNSIGGSRYFLTFIDDHSRKVFVYFLKNKNQVAQQKYANSKRSARTRREEE